MHGTTKGRILLKCSFVEVKSAVNQVETHVFQQQEQKKRSADLYLSGRFLYLNILYNITAYYINL